MDPVMGVSLAEPEASAPARQGAANEGFSDKIHLLKFELIDKLETLNRVRVAGLTSTRPPVDRSYKGIITTLNLKNDYRLRNLFQIPKQVFDKIFHFKLQIEEAAIMSFMMGFGIQSQYLLLKKKRKQQNQAHLFFLHVCLRIYGNSVTNMIPDFLLVSMSLGASKINGKNIMFMLYLFHGEFKKMKKIA
jgi:hypothetical protein